MAKFIIIFFFTLGSGIVYLTYNGINQEEILSLEHKKKKVAPVIPSYTPSTSDSDSYSSGSSSSNSYYGGSSSSYSSSSSSTSSSSSSYSNRSSRSNSSSSSRYNSSSYSYGK